MGKSHVGHIVRSLVKTSRLLFLVALICGLISGTGNVLLVAMMNYSLRPDGDFLPFLPYLFLGVLVVVVVTGVIAFLSVVQISQRIMIDLRLDLNHRILATPLQQLEEIGIDKLFTSLTDDVQTITQAFTVIPDFLMCLIISIGCLSYLAWLSPQTFLLGVIFLILGVGVYLWLLGKGYRGFTAARENEDYLFKHFRGITLGNKELKLNQWKSRFFLQNELGTASETLRKHNIIALTAFRLAHAWGQVLFFAFIALALFGPRPDDLYASSLVGFILTTTFLMTPLETMLNLVPIIFRGNVALEKIKGLQLSNPATEPMIDAFRHRMSQPESLMLVGTTFKYCSMSNDGFTVGPISLTLKSGKVVFLVGGNGSGKSTFAKLLVGLYIPTAGEMYLDSEPITNRNRDWYRQHFSVVFSDFYLFDFLLGANENHSISLASQYLRDFHLDGKVGIENDRFTTTALSQGQRKRLALLSAFLEDRPIYLFDEWAADQDSEFKNIFYTKILQDLKARGKAIIVITHDEAYYHLADQIVTLESGRLSERNSNSAHQNLFRLGEN
jgi:putative pyoverdin transport system ATP-binding/permease protein